jgi:hypothetical protein
MSEIEIEKSRAALSCEACGKVFVCGAESNDCWCFAIAISPENLAQLKEQFQRCLCRDCLQNISLPESKNS